MMVMVNFALSNDMDAVPTILMCDGCV